MIRRLIALFAAPSVGAAPAPTPALNPAPDSSRGHLARAHARGAQVHLAYQRWLSDRPGYEPEDLAEEMEVVAFAYWLAADRLRKEADEVARMEGLS